MRKSDGAAEDEAPRRDGSMTIWERLEAMGLDQQNQVALRAKLLHEIAARVSLRRMLARQIHDEVGQFATALAFSGDAIRSITAKREGDPVSGLVDDLCVVAGLCCRSIQNLLSSLRISKASLETELAAVVDEFSIDGGSPQFHLALTPALEGHVYPTGDMLCDALTAFLASVTVSSSPAWISLRLEISPSRERLQLLLESGDRRRWQERTDEPAWQEPWAKGRPIERTRQGFRALRFFEPEREGA